MDIRLLIDQIVRQTTVLIAQLSTAAGVRAPLSTIADQVFLELTSEIERQGVGKKVVADMFGMSLRTYQRRVQRVAESVTVRDKTLWEAVLEYLDKEGSRTREEVIERFQYDGEENVAAVLNDLSLNGVIYRVGRGGAWCTASPPIPTSIVWWPKMSSLPYKNLCGYSSTEWARARLKKSPVFCASTWSA